MAMGLIKAALFATAAFAVSMPAAAATNLIANGGFEDGSTNGNGNYNTPNSWTPNDAYTSYMYSGATALVPRTGYYSLTLGNYDSQPLATLSQTFADVVGGLYTASFYGFALSDSDPNAFLNVAVGSNSVTFLDNVTNYNLGSFTFIGTGLDTLSISAQTNRNTWSVDDVSVTGGAIPVSAVPEPATWAMMLLGFSAIGGAMRQRRSGKMPARALAN